MDRALKAATLDFALLKPYVKAICFVLLVPVIFTFISRSLISGVSFAMFVVAMSSSYTFAVSEKNAMERLYGILPVEKKHLVLGKYICVCGVGLLALLVSLILQPLVLLAMSAPVGINEILAAGMMGAVMFTFYIVFQVPGFYRYGSIKGRMFMYVPVVGFLLLYLLFSGTDAVFGSALAALLNSPAIAAALALLLIALMLFVSVVVSIKILKKKEL